MTSPNPFLGPDGTPAFLSDPNNPWAQQYWYNQWFAGTDAGRQKVEHEEQYRKYIQDEAEREYQLRVEQNERAAKQLELTEGSQKAQQWLARENLKLAQQAAKDQRLQADRSWDLQNRQFGLSQAQFGESQLQNDRSFGLGLLDRQLSMRGPRNAFAFIDAQDGANSLQPESGFLRRLVSGQYQPARGATTGRATLGEMIGQGENTARLQQRRDNDQALANQINANPANYAASYRRLSPYQQDYLKGAIEYGGGDEGSFLSSMRRGAFANRAY